MVDVAMQPSGSLVLSRDIAARQNVPTMFLTKIISQLVHAGLLQGFRGAGGGVILARPPEEITLRQIIEAVEGRVVVHRCSADSDRASSACPAHDIWMQAEADLNELFEQTKLADLARRVTTAS